MSRNRNATPILDTVRRQRAEDIREGRNPYHANAPRAPTYPFHVMHPPAKLAEAERMLAAGDPLTLELDK